MTSNLSRLSSDRLAPLAGHNKYQEVDKLYDPLRQSFDPYQPHAVNGGATMRSHVSHHQLNLTPQQRLQLVMEIADAERNHADTIAGQAAGTHLAAIDAVEKVGAPLTPEQMHEQMKHRRPDEVVVYQLGNVAPVLQKPAPPPPTPAYEPPIVIERPLGVGEYRLPTMKDIAPRQNKSYRYNLYSMIDEPVNRIMEAPGCNLFAVCTRCAPNEIIASRNQVRGNWLR